MKKFVCTIGIVGFIGLSFLLGHFVSAARFDLSPATAEFVTGCDSAVNININTEGRVSDAANILIHYNPASVEIIDANPGAAGIQIRNGNAYEAYADNTVLPAEGLIRLTGFSFLERLSDQGVFGTIIFRGRPGATNATFTIDFLAGSTTDSNIAEYLTSDDLLTGVANGSYTFRGGSCVADVTPPYVSNPSPVPDATGVPIDANVTFNISDSQSGVDLDSVTVNVDGTIYTEDGEDRFSYLGSPGEYSVAVNPAADFTPGAPVLVEINAADLNGNRMTPYRYVFNQPAVPPTPPSCAALGCAAPTTCATEPVLPEEIIEEPTVPESQKLLLNDFSFYGAGGSIQLLPNRNDEITTLLNTPVIVSAAASKFPREVGRIVITVNSFSYLLGYNPTADAYQTTIPMPAAAARFPLIISIDYADDAHDRIDGAFLLLSKGFVWQGTAANKVSGAKVTLYEESAGFRVWNAAPYHESNPQTTDANGQLSFLVPPGRYYLLVQKDGFRDEQTVVFEVANNVVNTQIEVLAKPPPLSEVWDPAAPITENVQNVAKNLGEKTIYAGEVVQKEVLDNPQVEKTTENVAAPAVAAVAIVSYGTAISLGSLLPFLQLIFTQPLLLLFPKRRKGWGIVYHSLSKMPVDLAIVRLYEKVTNRLVQTRVTDKEGRFAFFVQPGQYFIKVVKPNFSFPSNFVKDIKEDVKYLDIYHGEEITVTEKNTLVTPNIPIDPVEAERAVPDKRIVLAYFGRKAQNVIAPLGILAAAISVLISPQLWMVAVLAGHCLLYVLFRRLARSKKPKSWGIVYENRTKAPVGLTVARIFETEYNKLLETQVTDGRGRYSFLVGNNAYYVTFSKPGFAPKRTETIDLRGRKEGAAVGLDVGLDRE
ncbi:Ig-like domain-containing protein [Candidatus Falkowbacteria bacterium]|nr:Ig-like domain-containing protein [Candidatus Falkowbacteria bacterium]